MKWLEEMERNGEMKEMVGNASCLHRDRQISKTGQTVKSSIEEKNDIEVDGYSLNLCDQGVLW